MDKHLITVRELAEKCITRYGIDVLQGEINRMLLTQALTNQNKKVSQEDILSEIDELQIPGDTASTIRATQTYKHGSKPLPPKDNVTVDIYVKDAML